MKDIRQPHKSWWFRVSGEVKKNLRRADVARRIIRDIIRKRKESDLKFDDLLEMLLEARYEDTGMPMEEEQVIDEILILLIAGHETSANALSWALHLLAGHPEELEKLRHATAGLGLKETVENDPLAAVIKETLRLYPPAWITDRIALEDDRFGPFSYPAGTIVIMFFYGMHRDASHWENPELFLPARFENMNQGKEKVKSYFPFGAGPRLCIGNNFAMAEMAIALQAMVQGFNLKPGSSKPLMKPLITLRPHKVELGIEYRN